MVVKDTDTRMALSDDIGIRGEAVFVWLMMQDCGRPRPLFRPYFLGEKFPTLDYLVELVDTGPTTQSFFVQVKSTRQGYDRDKHGNLRLKVRVSANDMQRLALYPAPTYIVGIDEPQRRAYIVSAHQTNPTQLRGLPTTYSIDCQNLISLWHEVKDFWTQRDMQLRNSVFSIY